jgi:hypothetical protein
MKKFELTIPKPCHENWDAMSPEDKGRFCGACQKTVIDFTDMSDRQVAEFFKKPAGNVCGRFDGEQLNRVIEVPRKRIPWVKYFFTIALPAFLFAKKAAAQGMVLKKDKTEVYQKLTTKVETGKKGKIGLPNFKIEKVCNDSSLFARIPLVIPSETKIERFNPMVTQLSEIFSVRLGGVSVQPVRAKDISSIKTIPVKNIDTALSKFSIFPNPVERNSIFTIQTKDMEDGRYNMSIITSTGEVVQTKELMVENKLKRFTVQLENIAAAPYFIRLTNKANNKAYTEIILVK